MSRFRDSELKSSEGEQWLGTQLLEPSLQANTWVAIPEQDDPRTQKIVDAGYARRVASPEGKPHLMPTTKFAAFVKSRFVPPQAPR